MRVLPTIYWDIYAFFYERMKDFPVYQSMMEEVYNSLDVRKNGVYLDIGCGTGEFLKMLSENCKKAYGIDSSRFMLKMAMKKTSNSQKISTFQGDVTKNLPFKDEFFDGVACIHVINYLETPRNLLLEIHRILKTNGRLSLVSIKKLDPSNFLEHYRQFLRNNKAKAIKSLSSYIPVGILNAPMKFRYKVYYYDEKSLEKFLKDAGFRNIHTKNIYADQSILAVCKRKNA